MCLSAKVLEPVVARAPTVKRIRHTSFSECPDLTIFEVVHVKKIFYLQIQKANRSITINMLYSLSYCVYMVLKHALTRKNNVNEIK